MTFLFFGGKGGVGKTTLAAAAALRHAESGREVLLVSTDPAHSLGDALNVDLGPEPVDIRSRRGRLQAAELDADLALDRWLGERRAGLETIAERGSYLARQDVSRFLELGLPGADELIGLIELMRLVRETGCDEVVVDTAPTAHTLRLLAAPGELRRFAAALDRLQGRHRAVATAFAGGWHRDAADALIAEIETQGRELEALLRDPEQTAFFWVLLPEILSVEETKDGVRALEEAGIPVAELIVNRVSLRQGERQALAALRKALPGYELRLVPELAREPRGMTALRKVGRLLQRKDLKDSKDNKDTKDNRKRGRASFGSFESFTSFSSLVPETTRLLFFVGKGGVGKTTCAAAAALLLADARARKKRVLLLSADPAHSLADALDIPLGDNPRRVPGGAGLRARELDSFRTFAAWRDAHLAGVEETGGLLDLMPPGLDELSAVSALIDALKEQDLVIVDTAPTGHALRLLEAPVLLHGWVKELLALLLEYRDAVRLGQLAEELVAMSRDLRQLSETLHDPARTCFLAVTRNAELPRRETVRLLRELGRLGLEVPAVIVNVVSPADGLPKLRGRAIISAPAVFPPPRGVAKLRTWGQTWIVRDPK